MINRNSSPHQHCVATALQSFIRFSGHPALVLGKIVGRLVVLLIALHFVIHAIPEMTHGVHVLAAYLELTCLALKSRLNPCH